MFRRRRTQQPVSRGQAMVEFALVLPILALLLVFAIDFGRVFFGWVSVTNASRVAANFAAQYPEAWADNDTDVIDDYQDLVRDAITGCTPPATIPPPTFVESNGKPDVRGLGDGAEVTLTCDFTLLTPLAGSIVGQPLEIAGRSLFPIRVAEMALPPGTVVGNEPCVGVRVPNLVNMTVLDAQGFWSVSGFTGSFTASPAGDDRIVQTQATNPTAAVGACVDASTQVFVTTTAPPPCPAGELQVPNLVGKTLDVARLDWSAAGFSGAFSPANGNSAKVVLTQTTAPNVVSANGCLVDTGSVTVTYGDPPVPQCDVPNMVGLSAAGARQAWADAQFTEPLSVNGNKAVVDRQEPQQPATVPCDITGRVWMRDP